MAATTTMPPLTWSIISAGSSSSGSSGSRRRRLLRRTPDDEGQDRHSSTSPPGERRERLKGVHVVRSADVLANYDSFAFVHMIAPRPLLLIAGEEADTRYFSVDAFERAGRPKELFIVPCRSHSDLYNNVEGHMGKLMVFMDAGLCRE